MKKTYLLLIISLVFLGNIGIANGAITEEYKLLEPLPCIQGGEVPCGTGGNNIQTLDKISFNNYVGYVYRLTIAVAVFLTVVMMVVGGFEYMLSESFTKKGAGKDKMKDAALGLLGVLISYTVLETIDPRLVQIGVNIEPINTNNLSIGGNSSENFLNKLDKDLGLLSAQSLRNVTQDGEQIKSKTERITELENLMKEEQDPITYKEYEIERDKLKNEIVNLDSNIQKSMFQAVGQESLRQAFILIDDIETKYSGINNKFTADADIDLFIKKIEDRYKVAEEKVNLSDKQNLLKEKKFYIEQINEEKLFMSLVATYKSFSVNNSYSNDKNEIKSSLNDFAFRYKKELELVSKSAPTTYTDAYIKILNSRISKINSL